MCERTGKREKRTEKKLDMNDVVNSSEFGSTFLFIGESMNIAHIYTSSFFPSNDAAVWAVRAEVEIFMMEF